MIPKAVPPLCFKKVCLFLVAMIVQFSELVDVVVMSLAVGFIFKDAFKSPAQDLLHFYSKPGFNWEDFWFAVSVVAPAIILHELAHKAVALSMGLSAVFNAAYTWLLIGVLLKVMNFGFIFFVPGYVAITGSGTPFQYLVIALSGPLMHLLLWQVAKVKLQGRGLKRREEYFWSLVFQINKFLFVLNMLPIPGFDGFQVYSNLLRVFV